MPLKKTWTVYQPLLPRQRFGTYGQRAWLADDHLLIAKRRLFNESYSRFYWADIQSALLYKLERPTGFLLIMERLAVLSIPAAAIYLIAVEGPRLAAPSLLALGVLVVWYLAWLLTRPKWACQIATAITVEKFPLSGRGRVQDAIELIRQHTLEAQGQRHFTTDATGALLRVRSAPRRRPLLLIHWLIFCYGLLSWVLVMFQNRAIAPIYLLGWILEGSALFGAYFAQQNLEFPFAARSAAVLKILLVIAGIVSSYGLFLLGGRALPLSTNNNRVIFSLISVMISLYGVFALFLYSSEQSVSRLDTGRDALKIT